MAFGADLYGKTDGRNSHGVRTPDGYWNMDAKVSKLPWDF